MSEKLEQTSTAENEATGGATGGGATGAGAAAGAGAAGETPRPETAAATPTPSENPLFSQNRDETPTPSENPLFSQKPAATPTPETAAATPTPSENPLFSQNPAQQQDPDAALVEDFLAGAEISHAELAEALRAVHAQDREEFFAAIAQLDTLDFGLLCLQLPQPLLREILQFASLKKLSAAIRALESDDATDLMQQLHELDAKKAAAVFGYLDKDEQARILFLARYDDDAAGAWMQTELFSAQMHETLEAAIARYKLLKRADEQVVFMKLFITDEAQKLVYSLPVGDLILHDFAATFEQILSANPELAEQTHSIKDYDDIKDAIALVQDYDLSSLAVVDESGRLIGRITYDDIHDLLQEHATEQIYALAGVGDADSEDERPLRAARSRANWLLINMITSLLSANVIAMFSGAIEQLVALAALMPIVASMGGNTGSQALAVTVRKLALGEVEFADARGIIAREVAISLCNAAVFALLMGAVSFIWWHNAWLAVVMLISMVLNLTFAGLIGSLIPLTLARFKIDPAVGSSVILTALTDAVGFFSFLLLAKIILL